MADDLPVEDSTPAFPAEEAASDTQQPTASVESVPIRDKEYWQALQVYPDSLELPETKEGYSERTQRVLVQLSLGNLLYLCGKLGVPVREDELLPQPISHRLVQSEHSRLLACLATFLSQNASAVKEHFDNHFPSQLAQKIEAEIHHISKGRARTILQFTKLFAIYVRNPSDLETINYRYVWRKAVTTCEYAIEGEIPSDLQESLQGKQEALIRSLDSLKPSEDYAYRGLRTVNQGVVAILVHRRYPTRVKSDYRRWYRLQNDFGRVVFGLDVESKKLILKTPNKAIGTAIVDWFKSEFDVVLKDTSKTLYEDYEPDSVSKKLLGDYDESTGIDLLSLDFKYSSLPTASELMLTAAEHNRSIREELIWLRDHGVLKLSSLADLRSITIRFDGATIPVAVEPERGGAVVLRMNDAGIDEAHKEGAKRAFLKAFDIPLDQRIDPTRMIMGATDVYHYLLSGVDASQIRSYQQKQLSALQARNLIKEVMVATGRCINIGCVRNNQAIKGKSAANCPSCDAPIKFDSHLRYERNDKEVPKFIKKILQLVTDWKFTAEKNFEGVALHQLSSPDIASKSIYVFLNTRFSLVKVEKFQRSMFPILVVNPLGEQRAPAIDESGIAHLGLPCILTALEEKQSRKSFKKSLLRYVKTLLQMEHERVVKASRVSREIIENKPAGYDGAQYEAEVYNILRRLLPYSFKLGGNDKPDGFISFTCYEKNDLKAPVKYNFTYDAKYSASSYDFGIKEQRQMIDYINTWSDSDWMKTEGNKLDGHIIITNSMERTRMQGAADYLWAEHRLASGHPGMLIVFIREQFLTHIWDVVHENLHEISKRWLLFTPALMRIIGESKLNGFSLLDKPEAEIMMHRLLHGPKVEDPVNHELLMNDVAALIGMRKRARKRVADPNLN